MDVQKVRGEAIARVQARRRKPRYEPRRVGGQETQMQVGSLLAGEFEAPVTAGEYLDDKIAVLVPGLGPWVAAAYEIAEAARDGAAAGVKAIKPAIRPLTAAWDQWLLHELLLAWKDQAAGEAFTVLRAVCEAWEDAGLVMEQPAQVEPQAPDKPPARLKAKDYRARWGHPAGMAV